jgi:quercetin dioxygenase-like cupin family protein
MHAQSIFNPPCPDTMRTSRQIISLANVHTAPRTRALLKADSLELVHLVLPAGACLPVHAAPGEITLCGLVGTLTLELADRTLQLGPGALVHLSRGEPHAVRSDGGAHALLTICLHRTAPQRVEPRQAPADERRSTGAPVPGAAAA